VFRRFVFGSPSAKVTISGDTIGPTFPNDEAVTLATLFPTGHGRYGKGTEYHIFNLAANNWQLHYLRLTNQGQFFDHCCCLLDESLSFFTLKGSYHEIDKLIAKYT
jgi:hypothetical protein